MTAEKIQPSKDLSPARENGLSHIIMLICYRGH